MQRNQISRLIQMGSIGISDTTSADLLCHPEEIAHCRPQLRATLIEWLVGSAEARTPPLLGA
jgi:hypothetical protein